MHYTEPFRDRMFERTVFFTWEYFAPTEFVEKGGLLFNKLIPGRDWTQSGSANIQLSKTYEAGYGVTPLAGAWPYAVM